MRVMRGFAEMSGLTRLGGTREAACCPRVLDGSVMQKKGGVDWMLDGGWGFIIGMGIY